MFYGEYEHTLDRKGRLVIPSKIREALKEAYAEKLYITRGLDKCLFLFTEEEWKTQENKFKAMPFTKSEYRRFNRMYFSGAQEVVPDKQARILPAAYLKQYAGIKKEVVFVGVSNRVEIWDSSVWKKYSEESQGLFEEIAEKLTDE